MLYLKPRAKRKISKETSLFFRITFFFYYYFFVLCVLPKNMLKHVVVHSKPCVEVKVLERLCGISCFFFLLLLSLILSFSFFLSLSFFLSFFLFFSFLCLCAGSGGDCGQDFAGRKKVQACAVGAKRRLDFSD